jgi:hypothetical protein
LRAPALICYSSPPAFAAHEKLNRINQLSLPDDQVECTAEKDGVDELSETLHNLISLLLTNKTIRKRSKAVPNTDL